MKIHCISCNENKFGFSIVFLSNLFNYAVKLMFMNTTSLSVFTTITLGV